MSADLIDLRVKIDELTDTWLDAKEAELGKDRSETVRILLHDLAASEVRRATLLCNAMISKGLIKDDGRGLGKVGHDKT
jgi:hypothetical protein